MKAVPDGSIIQRCPAWFYAQDPWKQPCYKSDVFLSERHASGDYPSPLCSFLAVQEKIEWGLLSNSEWVLHLAHLDHSHEVAFQCHVYLSLTLFFKALIWYIDTNI